MAKYRDKVLVLSGQGILGDRPTLDISEAGLLLWQNQSIALDCHYKFMFS